jgi:hypothetical protein
MKTRKQEESFHTKFTSSRKGMIWTAKARLPSPLGRGVGGEVLSPHFPAIPTADKATFPG